MLSALAATPIAATLLMMLWRGWSAARAGAIGLGIALLFALTVFGLTPDDGNSSLAIALGGTVAEAGFTTGTILWIIWPALCIHALQVGTGRIDQLQGAMTQLTDDSLAQTLLVGWFFALFMEGAAGFGAPVALAAPLLLAMGIEPARALAIALIGHAAGVSFGAVGTPIVPQISATGLRGAELAVVPALLHGALGWVLVFALMRALGVSRPALGLLAAACFFVPYICLALLLGPELPTLAGAMVGGVAFAFVIRRRRTEEGPGSESRDPRALLSALAPYLALVVLILFTRLPGIGPYLSAITIGWTLGDRFSGSFAPLYHPGTLLAASFVVGWAVQGATVAQVREALRRGTAQLLPVVLPLLVMLILARLLVHSGMIGQLASDAASAFGASWPAIAPFVGMFGTFVTGSATTSNILFTQLQADIAGELDLSLTLLLGAQTFGAAVGNIVCPHNIVAGCATIGLVGREGEILRRTIPVGLLYALLGGILALGAGWVVQP
ncbi:L-lactate permease [Jannaschia aquimarina]|uniref:L-lactate permease n=1 Tax=Jannaschia aquimarina TaxID=935700 RepID=A0A0D1DB54_9RHOB|nr:L-lactate permease [Jannaschia aquimarina]KIT17173.1 Glycolate permease GlcA [Jannaschia aquimarina]SNT17784.1 lactate permease [Jannaschia aquimarina]